MEKVVHIFKSFKIIFYLIFLLKECAFLIGQSLKIFELNWTIWISNDSNGVWPCHTLQWPVPQLLATPATAVPALGTMPTHNHRPPVVGAPPVGRGRIPHVLPRHVAPLSPPAPLSTGPPPQIPALPRTLKKMSAAVAPHFIPPPHAFLLHPNRPV
jgi:hypothetical protein